MSEPQIKFQLLKPFGPSIVKVKIPENILKDLNNYVDKTINSEELSKKFDHGKNLIGNVKQEIKLDQEIMKKTGWLNFLATMTHNWIKHATNQTIKKFTIMDSWVVRQFANEYNPIHWHNGHISGAGFLKVPKTFGETFQKNKKNVNGKLLLVHGSKNFLSNSIFEITPEIGDFYFFPHYLMHLVYPFHDSDEERRSISFNAVIDENIYDVFSKKK